MQRSRSDEICESGSLSANWMTPATMWKTPALMNARTKGADAFYSVIIVCGILSSATLPAKVLDKLPKIRTHQHDPIEAAERIIAQMPNPPRIEYLRIDGILQCQYGLHLSAPARAFH
jgi:hypothetical protein